MTMVLYNTEAPKKATNLSINTDLLLKAKEKRINLSHTLENRRIEMLAEAQCQEWKRENQEAIETYNRRIQTNDVFSEGLRRF
ncbi:MAG: type II toxin-antitoxin system CcdA family antitoxin [Desulfohalobiaceae bacterium]|nr:type II toxin-antitoxin system CcdA family antitoxin [Desulfohalobiaceae bacterium]